MNNCNLPAIETEPPIPTPPDTVIAPVVEDVDAKELETLTVPPIFAFPVIPSPPETTNEPVVVENEFIDPLPICVYPPNSLKVTVCPADALMIGRPDISLTEKISPVDKLLSIENTDPCEPSKLSELSVRTVNVIGEEDVAPINDIVGFVVIPVNPNEAVANDN